MALPDLTAEELRLGNISLVAGQPCLDFCNTAEYRHTDHANEILTSYRGLLNWCHHANLLSEADMLALLLTISAEDSDIIFRRAFALREAIYEVFLTHLETQVAKKPVSAYALDVLNAEWQIAAANRKLIIQDKTLQWAWKEILAPARVLHSIVFSAVEVLTYDNLQWLRQCPNCGWLFLDLSRNHNRTWCNMQSCGNRVKVRRHYQRQKKP